MEIKIWCGMHCARVCGMQGTTLFFSAKDLIYWKTLKIFIGNGFLTKERKTLINIILKVIINNNMNNF